VRGFSDELVEGGFVCARPTIAVAANSNDSPMHRNQRLSMCLLGELQGLLM
jgi:hypothetical protein